MDKSPDAFRTISEVSEELDVPPHVLRFWESRFPQIRPVKRAGGRRYYRPADVALIAGIRKLLHEDGLTIRGVQKILREQGVRVVAALTGEDGGIEAYESEGMAVPEGDAPSQGTLWPDAPAADSDTPPPEGAPRPRSAEEEALGLLQDFWPEELLEAEGAGEAPLADPETAGDEAPPHTPADTVEIGIDADWVEEVHQTEAALAASVPEAAQPEDDFPAGGIPDQPVTPPRTVVPEAPPLRPDVPATLIEDAATDGEEGVPDLSLLPETAPAAPTVHRGPVPGLTGIALLLRNRAPDAPPLPEQAVILTRRLEALRIRMVAGSRGR